MAKHKVKGRRNPVARAPILGKGGVHEKSPSAKRQAEKRQLRKMLQQIKAGKSGLDFRGGHIQSRRRDSKR